MPLTCNGLELLDGCNEFGKLTCKWSKKKAGRTPKLIDFKSKKKPRPAIKNPKNICLVIDKDQLDYIKRQALQKSITEGVNIEANQLIREAIQRSFPLPKQLDMFGAKI